MPLPSTWPPRAPSGQRSIRFYKTGALTADFADNGWIFGDAANGANTFVPLPKIAPGSNTVVNLGPSPQGGGQNNSDDPAVMIWANNIRLTVTGGDLEYSFDGTNVHGRVLSGTSVLYRNRIEAGIAVRGAGTFYVEAW
jgi:hypothetical protein